MKTLLIIPAYNEAECIEGVVRELIDEYPEYDYVVVNDGSVDKTAEICRANGFKFIDLPVNLGLAGAFQAGVKYALKRGYDCAVQFDADGQHRPEHLAPLLDGLNRADISIGSRFLEQDKPTNLRGFGGTLIAAMIKLTTGVKLTDPTSGMRAYNKEALEILATGPNLGPEPDTLAYLIRKHGMKVTEVPMAIRDRMAGESYLNIRSSSAYMTRMAFSVLFIQFFR